MYQQSELFLVPKNASQSTSQLIDETQSALTGGKGWDSPWSHGSR
jgi:hypothetical protein